MAVLVSWSGDGLSQGPLTTSSAGPGDTPPTSIQVNAPAIVSSGPRPPRIEWPASVGSYAVWAHTPTSTAGWRWYGQYSGDEHRVCIAWTGSAAAWLLDIDFAGNLVLRDNAGAPLDSGGPIPLATLVRIGATYDAGQTDVFLYEGDSLTPVISLTAAQTSTSIVEWWWGATFPAGQAAFYGDDLVILDEAVLPGPVVVEPPVPIPAELKLTAIRDPLTLDAIPDRLTLTAID